MKRGTTNHPKMIALAARLKIPQAHAVGILHMLWEWTGNFAPAGDIGKWPDENIAAAVGWRGDATKLVEALIDPTGGNKSGWVDRSEKHRLIIHDWRQHAEDSVHAKVARTHSFFVCGTAPKVTGLRKDEAEVAKVFYGSQTPVQPVAMGLKTHQPLPLPLPVPVPVPEEARALQIANAIPTDSERRIRALAEQAPDQQDFEQGVNSAMQTLLSSLNPAATLATMEENIPLWWEAMRDGRAKKIKLLSWVIQDRDYLRKPREPTTQKPNLLSQREADYRAEMMKD